MTSDGKSSYWVEIVKREDFSLVSRVEITEWPLVPKVEHVWDPSNIKVEDLEQKYYLKMLPNS